jgi:hypothetical protein
MKIIINTTRKQALDLMDKMCPFKYDSAGNQYRDVPKWMYTMLYNSCDADYLEIMIGRALYENRH